MSKLNDPEFGAITLRRSKLSRSIRLRLDARGIISITLPPRAPLFLAKQLLNDSRGSIRSSLLKIHQYKPTYRHGDIIGKVHRLRIEQTTGRAYSHKLGQNELVVYTPSMTTPAKVQEAVREGIAKALRAQAKAYLPRRIKALADQHGFHYAKLRFSSAGTRWGSCSSERTISLNIWLMQLPFELIDYVIIHELCHTKHLNHSDEFWALVGRLCPNYKELKRRLKQHHPSA